MASARITTTRIIETHGGDLPSTCSTPEPVVFENDFSNLDDTDLENDGDAGSHFEQILPTESVTCKFKVDVEKDKYGHISTDENFEPICSDSLDASSQHQQVEFLTIWKDGGVGSEETTALRTTLHGKAQRGEDNSGFSSVKECEFLSLPTNFDGNKFDKLLRRQLSDSCSDEQSQHNRLSKWSSTGSIGKKNKNTQVKPKKNVSPLKSSQPGAEGVISGIHSRPLTEEFSETKPNVSSISEEHSKQDTFIPICSSKKESFQPVSVLSGHVKSEKNKQDVDVPDQGITATGQRSRVDVEILKSDFNGGLAELSEVASCMEKMSVDAGHIGQTEGHDMQSQLSQGVQSSQKDMMVNDGYGSFANYNQGMIGAECAVDPSEPGTIAVGTDPGAFGTEYARAPGMEYEAGSSFSKETFDQGSSFPNTKMPWGENDQYVGEEIGYSAMYAAQKKRRPRVMHRRMNGRGRGFGTSPMMMGDMTGEEEGNILSTARRMLQNSDGMSPYQSPLTMLMSVAQSMGVDYAYLMQNAESLGFDIPMPCTECYHKYERGQGQMPDFSMAKSVDVKCPNCGSQRTTIADMGRMILQMRKNIDEEDLIVYDVYPDGNCLFATVIDQLRVRGDFTQTVHSLRQRAVEYLRANPKQEDGTHLQVFLPSEEWGDYLKRMSEDGQWGDHMILGAISEVLGRNIVILGGTAKQFKTTIAPSKTKARDEDNLFLGHFGETHYISLRRRNWRDTLEQKLRGNLDLTEEEPHAVKPGEPAQSRGRQQSPGVTSGTDGSHLLQDSAVDTVSGIPVHHLNFFLKQLDRTKLIFASGFPDSSTSRMSTPIADNIGKHEFVGDLFNHLLPSVVPVEAYAPDMNIFFPGQASKHVDTDHVEQVLVGISSPHSIFVYPLDDLSSATHTDLIVKKEETHPGYLKLVPVDPTKFVPMLREMDGDNCLSYELWLAGQDDDDENKPAFMSARRLEDIGDPRVEIVTILALYCPQWPEEAVEWITRERPSGWPSPKEINSVVTRGCNVVAKRSSILEEEVVDPGQELDPDSVIWKYTFAVAEKRLAKSISHAQRQVYFVFRLLVDYQLNLKSCFPIYSLKSLFFYACECLGVEVWKTHPGSCLLYLIQRLNDCLREGKIPNYFIHEQNMLEDSTKEDLEGYLVNVGLLRRSIVICLYFMFDRHGLIGSEVGSIMDDVIEGIISFSSHGNVRHSFVESLVPASTRFARTLLTNEEFRSSVDSVNEVYQDMTRLYSDIQETTFYRLVYQTIQGLHIGYQWMFAFASDFLYKTNLVPAICEGHSTVSLSDVFGPDIVEYFGNVPVPVLLSITHGDIVSATKFICFLEEQKMDEVIVKGLRFYLDMYSFTYPLPEKEELKKALAQYGQCSPKCRIDVCPYLIRMRIAYLQSLHVHLWYSYHNLNLIEEFRPLMERMEAITDLLDSPRLYQSLVVMWTKLGDEERADLAQEKANAVDPAASMSNVW